MKFSIINMQWLTIKNKLNYLLFFEFWVFLDNFIWHGDVLSRFISVIL